MQASEILGNQDLLNEDLAKSPNAKPCLKVLMESKAKVPSGTVLQLQSANNISVPKRNQEESRVRFDASKHCLKFTLTDGSFTVTCYLFDGHPELSDETPPGTKVKVLRDVAFKAKHLIFSRDAIQILGGHVKQLEEAWRVSKELDRTYHVWGSSVSQTNSQTCPPKWKEFSFNQNLNKIVPNLQELKRQAQAKSETESKPASEFDLQRSANISKLTEQLGDLTMCKTFGEGKQLIRKDVQEIMKEGFSEEEAEIALAKFKSVKNALKHLQPNVNGEESRKSLPAKEPHKGRKPNKQLDNLDYSDDENDAEYQKQKHNTTNTLFDFVKGIIPQNQNEVNHIPDTSSQQRNFVRGGGRGVPYRGDSAGGNYPQRTYNRGYENGDTSTYQHQQPEYNSSRGRGSGRSRGGGFRGRGPGFPSRGRSFYRSRGPPL